jgi:chromosome partitioning protein
MAHSIHLSYAEPDAALADMIRQRLADQGVVARAAAPQARQGEFSPALSQALQESGCVIFIVSPAADADGWVRKEVQFALANARIVVTVEAGPVAPDGWIARHVDLGGAIPASDGLDPGLQTTLDGMVRASLGAGRAATLLNIKGGVGKTILAANLAAAAHLVRDYSVALVDLDPQHNLSQLFLPAEERHRVRDDGNTIHAIFTGSRRPAGFDRMPVQLNRARGQGKKRFDLIVGDEHLFEYTMNLRSEAEVQTGKARFHAFSTYLKTHYDLVFIDSNPCATVLTRCAVAVSDHIIAPVRPERSSLTGLNMLEQVVKSVRGRPLRPQEFSVLLNGLGDRPRTRDGVNVDGATREQIETVPFFGSALLANVIPFAPALRGTPVDRYATNPINLSVVMRPLTPRALKEKLSFAALEVLSRMGLGDGPTER